MGITINGPSGIDTASLIDQLVGLEQDKVTTVQNQKAAYQVQVDDYSKIKSMLADLQTKAVALNQESSFDVFTSSSSDNTIATITGGAGAIESSYDLTVNHLAKSEKMISKDSLVTDQTAALSTFGVTPGDISIDGTTITITGTDTIQDLRMKINNATDSSGNKLGVTASVLKLSDSNYRLVLSANNNGVDSGDKGVGYKDVSGNVLQTLGIITDAAGDKGSTNQTIATQNNFQNVFDGLAVGNTITYAGIDHDGNQVTNTFVKTATSTVNDFLAQVKSTYHSMVDATVDATSGQLIITDKATGSSQLMLNSLNAGAAPQALTVTQSGTNGAGVMTAGSNSYFNLDGLDMNSASNAPADVVTGVTFQFNKASPSTSTSLGLSRDVTTIQKNVQNLLDSYNTFLSYVTTSTAAADPNDSTSKAGDLHGDMTIQNMADQVKNALETQFNMFGGNTTSLANLGITGDAQTGQMSIDSTAFSTAVTNNFDQVLKIFVTNGISDNKTVAYGRSTDATKSGNYTLHELDANYLQIQDPSTGTWYTSDARQGDVVFFSSGPASGLALSSPSGLLSGGDATFTFQKGLGDLLNGMINSITDPSNGTIQTHQDSLQSLMSDADSRIASMQTSVDDYKTRLTNQFAAMEQTLNTMKSQSANMLSSLGTTTTTT